MTNYYNRVEGNLHPGEIAKSEDIHQIQTNVSDMSRSMIDDHHDHSSYILGSRENDFLLLPSKKILGRYLDTYSIPTENNLIGLSIREYNYRQPIAKTKSTLYSVILKLGNNTKHNVPVKCNLINPNLDDPIIRSYTVTLPANTDKAEYEFIFDYKECPTAFGLSMEELKREDGRHIPPNTREESYKQGAEYKNPEDIKMFSNGVTQLYIEIEALGIQISDIDMDGKKFTEELDSNSFVVYADRNGEYGGTFDSYLEQSQGTVFERTAYSLFFKDVYATDINYTCNGGEAIIGGEKVICEDSHVTISGSHEYGNVLSLVYMDSQGHLHSANSKASIGQTSTNIMDWEMDDILPPSYLLIAKVLVYSDVNKEPLIIQDDTNQETRPRSHHERLRRLEKKMGYTSDIAIPPRFKYTLTGDDWVDKEGDAGLLASIYKTGAQDSDADKSNYYLTMDGEGNLIVKSTESEVTVAPVTLKDDANTVDTSRVIPSEIAPDKYSVTIDMPVISSSTSEGGTQVAKVITGKMDANFSKGKDVDALFKQMQEDYKNGATLDEISNKYHLTDAKITDESVPTGSTTTIKVGSEKKTYQVETSSQSAIDTNITTSQTDPIFKNYEPDDLRRLNRIAEMTNISLDSKSGKISLKNKSVSKEYQIATTDEEAKETQFNLWDDFAENRPENKEVTPTSRQYTVVAGKDGDYDQDSEFPAMTFYADKKYNLTALQIPITKFENCSAVKFFIWKRQGPNNKTNTVWLEKKLYTSKEFSLENARTDNKYQYIDEGFKIEFGSGGLDLPQGQYVIIALPIPKSGSGSCWVDTYKPKNSKDFCIRYYGASNASHFLLKERYQEIWYNSAMATGTKTSYEKDGFFTSGTITLGEDKAPIAAVKTEIGKTTIPEGCSIEVYGDTGSGFQKLNTNSNTIDGVEEDDGNTTVMKGNRITFRWKVVLRSNEENTPSLEYDEEKKYALQFTFVHEAPATGNSSAALELSDNNCITSIPLDGDGILREYLGDYNFDVDDNRFSNFEWARVWANKSDNTNLVIDLSGSDLTQTIKDASNNSHKFSAYSLHYVDLGLKDFSHTSVDYSNYDAELEKDEYNMRLKLDTQNSYNDNDIQIFNVNEFDNIEDDTNVIKFSDKSVTIPKNYNPGKNVLLYRLRLKNPIDLTKYTGIKVALDVKKGSDTSSLKGMGIYLSSQYEETIPSNELNDPSDVLPGSKALLDSFTKKTNYYDLVKKYKDKIIKIPSDRNDGLKASSAEYYKFVAVYDNDTNGLSYELRQLHDIKSYYIYELGTIKPDTKEDKIMYQEIEIDQDSTNLKYVEEVGIILLGDENIIVGDNEIPKLSVNDNVTLSLNQFKAIKNDYYPVFNPKEHYEMKLFDESMTALTSNYFIRKNGEITIDANTYGALGIQGSVPKKFTTDVMQINIKPSAMSSAGQTLCYFPNKFATKKYKHIGIQIASDVYIPKYSLQLNLCSDTQGKNVIESVNIPTLNYIYTPNKEGTIELSQVFKKIENLDVEVQSLSISTTNRFKKYIESTLGTAKPRINIFVGKIVMYKAETIPMFHRKMRFKFYDKNREYLSASYSANAPTVYTKNTDNSMIMIRKIGAVLNYR